MLTIAITGNFGMGKTQVLKMFHQLGALTFDSDEIVHKILLSSDVVQQISKLLGDRVLLRKFTTKQINKKALAGIIFADPQKRVAIERIIHPKVLNEIKNIKASVKKKDDNTILIFEVPLLFEAGYENHFDRTIVVHSKRETAIQRLIKKGLTRDQIIKRLNAQMPMTQKKMRADYLIDNDGDTDKTKKQVENIFKNLMAPC